MGLEILEKIILHNNNKMNIALTKNIKSQHCTKYINIQYYYICKFISKKKHTIKWISSSKLLANKMIKASLNMNFKKYWALLRLAIN